jgi:hypothetical protein
VSTVLRRTSLDKERFLRPLSGLPARRAPGAAAARTIVAEIRGFGHSQHTFKMPNKPIKQGYKLFAIADQGYILY